jgi:lipopolysaccharide transport system permease protein
LPRTGPVSGCTGGSIGVISATIAVVPAASSIVCFVDFLISSTFLVLRMFSYHFVPPVQIVVLPFFVLLTFAASLGAGLWISALMVKYRDFRFIVPFIIQFGLYVSPVVLMTASIPARWRLIYSLNPVVGIIDGFRWCLLGRENLIYWPGLAASITCVTLLLVSGLWYFRSTERTFADVI